MPSSGATSAPSKESGRDATPAATLGGGRTLEGLERALDVLMLFARPDAADLGVSEISRELGLPKAVVHRIVTTLCSRDFLELRPATRRYALGPSWLVMGSTYAQRVDVRDLTREAMRRLSEATGETTTLSIRHGDHRVYLDQFTPPREVIMSVQVGARFPLHAGSSSRAFLAYLPPAEQEEYLAGPALERLTAQTLTDHGELREELHQIRARGYAVSFGERQAGAGAVAAPLLDVEHRPVAVMSVCGPAERIHGRVEELAEALLAETRAASARLGHAPS